MIFKVSLGILVIAYMILCISSWVSLYEDSRGSGLKSILYINRFFKDMKVQSWKHWPFVFLLWLSLIVAMPLWLTALESRKERGR